MTNYEYYKNEIDKITRMGGKVAMNVNTNEIVPCSTLVCSECLFNSYYCIVNAMKWADAEYVESKPKIDWTKVPIDTPILVKYSIEGTWEKRYFARYEDGKVYSWSNGMASFTTNRTNFWPYAKLAEVE